MIKPKIIFVAQSGTENEYLDQSSRYRVYNPAKALAKKGYSVNVVKDYYDDSFPMYGDVYVFHRPIFSEAFIDVFERLSSAGVKLICDFDDLNFDPSTITENAFFIVRDRVKVSDQAAQHYEAGSFFDNFIVSSNKLGENCLRIFGRKNYITIGLGVDDDLFEHIDANRNHYLRGKGRNSIGYFAGSNTHALDFPLIERAVNKFINEHPRNNFILMGQITPSRLLVSHPNFTHLPRMPYEQLFEHASLCKVIVAPLQTSKFNEVKAATKIIENALVEAHTCASPTPGFDETGLYYSVARTEDDWMEYMSIDYLRSFGGEKSRANYEILRENLLMSVMVEKYEKAFGFL